jgi:glycosyltransferase involved in cell wall biosynthesis
MKTSDLRIAYLPGERDFSAPCDRRRFVAYARARGIEFELADPREKYDLVVLSQRADLSVWSQYRPGEAKIVFDSVDSYLAADGLKATLRGLAKFATRASRHLQFNYRKAVARMCQRADAVVCSTEEQRAHIREYCPNVHLILDVHDSELHEMKRDYAGGKKLHLVWEGLASSGIPLELLHQLIEPLAAEREIVLHVVTDLVYWKYLDRVGKRHTVDDVRRVFGPLARQVHLYDWNPLAISRIATAADLALIPIDLSNSFHRGKPENKLLLFWRMGVPTLTSATPAYRRAMALAGLDMACENMEQFRSRLDSFAADRSLREAAGQRGLEVVREHYSAAAMLGKWDHVFESILSGSVHRE